MSEAVTMEKPGGACGAHTGRARPGWRMAALALLACALSDHAAAQSGAEDWPNKQTVKIIVPFSAGSNADLMGRLLATEFGEAFKGTFVVENRVGTGGILGTRALAKSPPDGYTLCVCSGGAITVPSVVEKGYDPLTELVPVSRVNTQPLVLIVNPNSEMKTVADVIAASKKKDGGLNYGSSGVGGLMYNAAEVFKSKTGAQMTHIPFKGGPEATQALTAGEIDVVFAIMSDVVGQVAAKTVRPVAVTTGTRSKALPDTPTMIEYGVKDYDIALWNGLFVPRGTPQVVIDKLSALMLKLPGDEALQTAVGKIGATLTVSTPGQLGLDIRAESALWEAGLKDVVRK
jgi:tripartite-type tricarboxylate transporter receptor subunit TctC